MNEEIITSDELCRAACCNLGESFVTNPSVDVSYSDAATGAKQIKLLGLSGTYVQMLTDPSDKRARLVQLTEAGQKVWQHDAAVSIAAYYEQALEGFSSNDMVHTLHYLLKLLDNMQAIDARQTGGSEADDAP